MIERAVRAGSRPRADYVGELIVVLCLGVLPHLVNAVIGLVSPGGERGDPAVSYIMGIAMSLQVAIPMLWIMQRSGTPLREFGVMRVEWGKDVGLAAGVCGATLCAAWMSRDVVEVMCGMEWLSRVIHAVPRESGEMLHEAPVRGAAFALVVAYDVSNGFAEELVIRAYLMTRLAMMLGAKWRAVVAAAAIMASYHIYQGSYAALELFLTESAICVLWLVVRRVWPFAVGHAMYNVLLMVMYHGT